MKILIIKWWLLWSFLSFSNTLRHLHSFLELKAFALLWLCLQQRQEMTWQQHLHPPLNLLRALERQREQEECHRRMQSLAWPQLHLAPLSLSHPSAHSSLCPRRNRRRWAPTPLPLLWFSPPHLQETAASHNTVSGLWIVNCVYQFWVWRKKDIWWNH